jgi:hypothetical protein
MYLLGHTDPKFTMRVYQQVLDMGGAAPEQLERALGCGREQALAVLTARGVRGLIEDSGQNGSIAALELRVRARKSPAKAGLLGERLKGFEPSTFCMASRT